MGGKPWCFLDISIGEELEGRIIVELFNDVVPKTAENFSALCTGGKGICPAPFQGGDISAGDGTGGESIYGLKFEDENFELKHERKGMLSMANAGPNTNGSQFFITTTRTSHLDGKHVVFGKVIKGMGVVCSVEHVTIGENDCPSVDIVISDCGEIPEGADDGIINFFKDGDLFPDWPADLDDNSGEFSWWMSAVESIKGYGNEHFKKQDYKMALRKYRKALQYLDICWEKEGIDEDKSLYLRKMKPHIFTNSAVCKLKLGDLTGALLDTCFAMCDDENNAKALFRQGQYWVSQGNKWCDICKIWISNNPASIRNHELGQRHKANVSQKLSTMREEKAAKDKEQKAAVRVMEQIESKAKRSYQKDLASFQEARDSNANALLAEDNNKVTGGGSAMSKDWEYESSSGYYYNQRTSCYYDPNSGFYYTDFIGKWVTREEALAASQESSESSRKKSIIGKPPLATANKLATESKSASISQTAPPPGRVVSTSLNPMRSIKGAPSSVTVSKRKRADEKPQAVSEEEAVAIKAREAAKKRVEKREKPLLGLYKR